ncbi:MAG: hypothetical protein J6Q84_06275, partial [Kiritimatiellae bacterium]|nr:hypothetical protein [Kiritimatiellia bacterium]
MKNTVLGMFFGKTKSVLLTLFAALCVGNMWAGSLSFEAQNFAVSEDGTITFNAKLGYHGTTADRYAQLTAVGYNANGDMTFEETKLIGENLTELKLEEEGEGDGYVIQPLTIANSGLSATENYKVKFHFWAVKADGSLSADYDITRYVLPPVGITGVTAKYDDLKFRVFGNIESGYNVSAIKVNYIVGTGTPNLVAYATVDAEAGTFLCEIPYTPKGYTLTYKITVEYADGTSKVYLDDVNGVDTLVKTRLTADNTKVIYAWTGEGDGTSWTDELNWTVNRDDVDTVGYPGTHDGSYYRTMFTISDDVECIDLQGGTYGFTDDGAMFIYANKTVKFKNGTLRFTSGNVSRTKADNTGSSSDYLGSNGGTLIFEDVKLRHCNDSGSEGNNILTVTPRSGATIVFEGTYSDNWDYYPQNDNTGTKIIIRDGELTLSRNLNSYANGSENDVLISNAKWTIDNASTKTLTPFKTLSFRDGPNRQAQVVNTGDLKLLGTYDFAIPEEPYSTPYYTLRKLASADAGTIKVDVSNYNSGDRVPLIAFSGALVANTTNAMNTITTTASKLVVTANGVDVKAKRNAKLVWDELDKTLYFQQDSQSVATYAGDAQNLSFDVETKTVSFTWNCYLYDTIDNYKLKAVLEYGGATVTNKVTTKELVSTRWYVMKFDKTLEDLEVGDVLRVKFSLCYGDSDANIDNTWGDDSFSYTIDTRGVLTSNCEWDVDRKKFLVSGKVAGDGIKGIKVKYKITDAELTELPEDVIIENAEYDSATGTYKIEIPYVNEKSYLIWSVYTVLNDGEEKEFKDPATEKSVFTDWQNEAGYIAYTWTGAAGDNLWSNSLNWEESIKRSLKGVPGYASAYGYYTSTACFNTDAEVDLNGQSYYLGEDNRGFKMSEGITVKLKNGTLGFEPHSDGSRTTLNFGKANSTLVLNNLTMPYTASKSNEWYNLKPVASSTVVVEGDKNYYWRFTPGNKNTKFKVMGGTVQSSYFAVTPGSGSQLEIENGVYIVKADVDNGLAATTTFRDGPDRQARLWLRDSISGTVYYKLKLYGTYDIKLPETPYSDPYVLAKLLSTNATCTMNIDVSDYKLGTLVPLIQFRGRGALDDNTKNVMITMTNDVSKLVVTANGVDVKAKRNAKLVWDEADKTLYFQQDEQSAGETALDSFGWSSKITITATNEVALTNFPMLIRIKEDEPKGFKYKYVNEGGSDIRFIYRDKEGNVALDETANEPKILDHEIDTWDTSGESVIWVKVPQYEQGASVTMYWGELANKEMPKAKDSKTVWSDYVAVWHMDDAEDAKNGGKGRLGSNTQQYTGIFGKAYGNKSNSGGAILAATNTESTVAMNTLNGNTDPETGEDRYYQSKTFTASFWVYLNGNSSADAMVIARKSSWNTPADQGWGFSFCTANDYRHIRYWFKDDDGFSSETMTKAVAPKAWHRMDIIFDDWYDHDDGDTGYSSVWLDGEKVDTCNIQSTFASVDALTRPFQIGGLAVPTISNGVITKFTESKPLNGRIDEMRVRQGTLPEAWIKADYDQVRNTCYQFDEAAGTSNVIFKNSWVVEPSITLTEWTQGETAGVLTAGVAKFGTVTASMTELPTEVGSYTITYTVAGDKNYTGLTATVQFEIKVPEVVEPEEPGDDPVSQIPTIPAEWGYVKTDLGD